MAGKHAQGLVPLGALPVFQGCGPVTRMQQGDARRRRPGAVFLAAAWPISRTDRLNLVPWTPAPAWMEPEGLGLVHLTGVSHPLFGADRKLFY